MPSPTASANRAKARVALFKGGLILLAALAVMAQIAYRLLFNPAVPVFEVMGLFSAVGLAANLTCLLLLWRHRHEDVNMSSVWECSRNDIASNLSVFAAAGAVWLTGSGWPDLVVASALCLPPSVPPPAGHPAAGGGTAAGRAKGFRR